MIPTTDNLKEINPELTKALKNFPDLINQWEQKLRAITPYCAVMIPDANEYHDDMDDEKGAFGGFLGHTYDTEDLFTTSTVIAFQTMACIEQWLQEKIETDYPEVYQFLDEIPATIPSEKGEMGILADHEATISKLTKGVVKVLDKKDHVLKEYEVQGGFAEMFNNRLLVLID
jgi:hypothetical protein